MCKKNTLLITSIGKRVELIEHLKKTFRIIGADACDMNAGRYFVDKFYKISKADEKGYIDTITTICIEEKVKGIIPLYEGEFDILNLYREKIEDTGAKLILSGREVVHICKNKKKTYEYFINSDIKIPEIYGNNQINKIIKEKDISKLPLFIKPRDGMGSSNVFKINTVEELKFFNQYVDNNIIQEYIDGEEYTVDCLTDFDGECIYVLPRKRLEIRSGEVVKSCTVHDNHIIKKSIEVIKYLNNKKDENGLGAIGPLTLQFFKNSEQIIYLIEINPRFGGGVPLSFACGADYGSALNIMLNKGKIKFCNDFKERIMIHYDQSVFL